MDIHGKNNEVSCGENVTLTGTITGENNTVSIGSAREYSSIRLSINGTNNQIRIDDCYQIKGLAIQCGCHVAAHSTRLTIGSQFSMEPGCAFLLYNSTNQISIGRDCLFSNGIIIRCGESPHLIFEASSGNYIDVSDGVSIGNHVWVGERVYINKRSAVPDNCIVAACSVVTKRFDEQFAVIAGNPSRVVKADVQWVRNRDFLAPGSKLSAGYKRFQDHLNERLNAGVTDFEL
ncbi:acetyltransferase-like isoleucine patch superfamily enzyme [Bradyrhizobium sp. USDA 4524]|uniref:hypothetical protein n=1 Tax=unclassified Bradyrhizobium TaxID=2631580 RepID=UPI00209FAEC1|nr:MULTISPECIES: hypothetical protein [unclassified Bradyrhizobium]MCP1845645.1 acetyltransferase-like isoleucine patch superfamily enzyme [Bradyrhizobium sp. USDA 4538]MCP1907031.1 acetyltransferase-like isoleucine patch superfamily enzyme [Bradyrhizobium sp. USDA 4537]MCP1985507.1 acetyltransferase-like isoleucine patch superfamily enzyme [Bradyrhizobium sp. USDA 4539]